MLSCYRRYLETGAEGRMKRGLGEGEILWDVRENHVYLDEAVAFETRAFVRRARLGANKFVIGPKMTAYTPLTFPKADTVQITQEIREK